MSENTPLQGSGAIRSGGSVPGGRVQERAVPHTAKRDSMAKRRRAMRLLASLMVGAGWLVFATPALPVWLGGGMSV